MKGGPEPVPGDCQHAVITTSDLPGRPHLCHHIQSVVHARQAAKGGSIRTSLVPAPRIQTVVTCR